MSTTSSPDPEVGMPLTRRQRRALERAQQAQQEAATQDLPALSHPAVQTRPAGTASPGTRPATGRALNCNRSQSHSHGLSHSLGYRVAAMILAARTRRPHELIDAICLISPGTGTTRWSPKPRSRNRRSGDVPWAARWGACPGVLWRSA